MRVRKITWTGSSPIIHELVRVDSMCFLVWTMKGSLIHSLSFLKPKLWMLAGMPKENQSQPGHPQPAVDSTEGRRNERKCIHHLRKSGYKRLAKNPFISVIWGDQRQIPGWQENSQQRGVVWEKDANQGTTVDQLLDSTLFQWTSRKKHASSVWAVKA